MIVYKIDEQHHMSASAQIKDMRAVLDEVAVTLEILNNLLIEHGQSISTPNIDSFRIDLQQDVEEAIQLAHRIAENSQQVCAVGDQAAKHMAALDDHFEAALHAKQHNATRTPVQV